jgi:hypothetical protein
MMRQGWLRAIHVGFERFVSWVGVVMGGIPDQNRFSQPVLLSSILTCLVASGCATQVVADDPKKPEAHVGVSGRIDGLVLPGPELQVSPVSDRRLPIMLRIVETYVHGDAFRYDLEFIGLEQGEFDLRDYLSRKDGTGTESLPSIPVKINSLLPPGHLIPHELQSNLPRMRGYGVWVLLATVAWLLGLVGLIVWRRQAVQAEQQAARPKTFAELLAPRLAAASSGALSTSQLAELERFVVEFWRRRLSLADVPVNQAITQLRRHPEAGPLLLQLEQWIHSPVASITDRGVGGQAVTNTGARIETRNERQLAAMLEPYRKFPADPKEPE